MKFEGTQVWGMENATIGMRLPMSKDYLDAVGKTADEESNAKVQKNLIGADDKAAHGTPNSKFMRMVHVQVAITAPLCWWKEMDTYKVATTANSSSTMHRIQTYPITEDCFEKNPITGKISPLIDIDRLEQMRLEYNKYTAQIKEIAKPEVSYVPDMFATKEEYIADLKRNQKALWYDIIYGLGDSWLQTRMWDASYSTVREIYYWRKSHKQNCWSGLDNPNEDYFCKWVETLPHSELLIGE